MYSRFGKSSQLLGIQSMLFSVRILQITTLKISHTCIYNNTNRLTCVAQKFKKHFRIIKASSNQTIKAIMQEVEYSHSFQSFRQCSFKLFSFLFMLTDVFLTLLGNDDSVCLDISSLMTVIYILGLF